MEGKGVAELNVPHISWALSRALALLNSLPHLYLLYSHPKPTAQNPHYLPKYWLQILVLF